MNDTGIQRFVKKGQSPNIRLTRPNNPDLTLVCRFYFDLKPAVGRPSKEMASEEEIKTAYRKLAK